MDSIYDLILACFSVLVLTVGAVQLIDYERKRKFDKQMERIRLRQWFSRKMYNFYNYGDIDGRYRMTFTDEYPEYDLDRLFEEQTDPDNPYKNRRNKF